MWSFWTDITAVVLARAPSDMQSTSYVSEVFVAWNAVLME